MTGWRTLTLPAILVLAMLVLLLRLGFWQLERAHSKDELMERAMGNRARPPVPLEQLRPSGFPQREFFRRVQARGRFDRTHQYLLDNRTHAGRAGYHVLTPLLLGEDAILVNRGWVPVGSQRTILPALNPVDDVADLAVTGLVSAPPRPGLVLGETGHEPSAPWPRVVQTVDLEAMSDAIGRKLVPVILLMDPGHPGCHVCEWKPVVSLPAATHRGYALQWFSLAVALVILSAWAYMRTSRHDR